VQADLAQPAIGATGDQPYGGLHPLYAGEDQPKHGKQQFPGPADLLPVVVQDGQVVVFAQFRGTVGPLQGVDADRHAVVLQDGVPIPVAFRSIVMKVACWPGRWQLSGASVLSAWRTGSHCRPRATSWRGGGWRSADSGSWLADDGFEGLPSSGSPRVMWRSRL